MNIQTLTDEHYFYVHPTGKLYCTFVQICRPPIDTTDSECPSHSDFDILRSSLFRMGKMGGGSRNGTPPGPTTSVPAGHSDELQLPDQIPF